jgi:sarcosine oxidase delta subunit
MKIISQAKQEFTVILQLTEDEARALHDITAYGYDAFMSVFKEKLGKAYIEKHEKGSKSLFEVVRDVMPQHFHKIDTARNAFTSVNKHLD